MIAKPVVMVNIRLDPALYERIRAQAVKEGVTIAAVIRRMLEAGVEKKREV